MSDNENILAIFSDAEDERDWNRMLSQLPGVIRVMDGENLLLSLENLRKSGINPLLTIISSRAYLKRHSDLTAFVRTSFPDSDFLLVSTVTGPHPPLKALMLDRIRHLVINHGDEANAHRQLALAATRLLGRRAWQMADYLAPGTTIRQFDNCSAATKEELIRSLEAIIEGDTPEIEELRQKGALLADEMLENALYGAPRAEDGGKLFQKGEQRKLLPGERILFRAGFDGTTLAMEVADGWGSLSPDLVLEYLAKNQEEREYLDDTGGRGFFIIWHFLDHFHVNIVPGKLTTIGGQVTVSSVTDPSVPKGFHITTNPCEGGNYHGQSL